MAKPDLFHDTFRGKLGDVVGSEWRGIEYWRTYAKPKQPKTPAQLLHYDNFRRMITIANALHKTWFPYIFSEVPGKTLSNQFMTLNKGIYATDGITYKPRFPSTLSVSPITGRDTEFNDNYFESTRIFDPPVPSGTVQHILTLAYCADKYEIGYAINDAIGQTVHIVYPSNWSGCHVYIGSQLITSQGVYGINLASRSNYPN